MHINYLIDNYKAICLAVIATAKRLPMPIATLPASPTLQKFRSENGKCSLLTIPTHVAT